MRHRANRRIAIGAALVAMVASFVAFVPSAYAATLTQGPPMTGLATPATSSAFSAQLTTTNNVGAVTYAQMTGGPQLLVSASGLVTTNGTLSVGSYPTTGTTADTGLNTGVFSFTLTVTAGAISQTAPTAGSVAASASASFTDQLNTTGGIGAVHFTQTTGAQINVSATGHVTTTGALAAGNYTATGTTSDGSGDSGTFSYTLTVTSIPGRADERDGPRGVPVAPRFDGLRPPPTVEARSPATVITPRPAHCQCAVGHLAVGVQA